MQTKTNISDNKPRNESALIKYGVRRAFIQSNITDFPDTEATKAVNNYLKDLARAYYEGDGFYLWGEPGIGKSRLSHAAFIDIYDKRFDIGLNKSVRIVEFSSIFQELSVSWNFAESAKAKSIEMLIQRAGYLLIDNLPPQTQANKNADRALHQILSIRSGNRKPTWITSTIEPRRIVEHYPSCVDLVEDLFIPVKCEFPDRRREERRLKKERYVTRS